jgi:hypothetical protein
MLNWWEAPPALTRAFRGNAPLAKFSGMIDDIHVSDSAPWHWKPEIQGTAFTSSAGVADYFWRAYGWTVESLKEEQAPRLAVALQNAPTFGYGGAPTAAEAAIEEAKSVLLTWDKSGR